MARLTPLMRQYLKIKSQYRDAILLFRMGDFYETFYDDAKIASKELNIVLTSRNKGKDAVPLAGIPYHALDHYLGKLIGKGYKVAICEQVEDPKTARGLVRREVVRVITPGTVIEESLLPDKNNNYLMAIVCDDGTFGLSVIDTSTGEFLTTEIRGEDAVETLMAEISRFRPVECIMPEGTAMPKQIIEMLKESGVAMNEWSSLAFQISTARRYLLDHFGVVSLEGLGCDDLDLAVMAAGGALHYVKEMQGSPLDYISTLTTYSTSQYMVLDATTLRNLEIFENIHDRGRRGTLFELLDLTNTAMGSRLLRKFLQHPLMDPEVIGRRLDGVEELKNDVFLRSNLRGVLAEISDLERLISRIVYGSASPRDLVALRDSLTVAEKIRNDFEFRSDVLREASGDMMSLQDVVNLIKRAIVDDPPNNMREGGIIRPGYSQELDELRKIASEGKRWIMELERRERLRTGIKNLKVGYNQVFGYYIEVSRSYLKRVPSHYVRKQTLTSAERFITEELKEKEAQILTAKERMERLEYHLFVEVRSKIASRSKDIQRTAKGVATLDVLSALAERADRSDYTRPTVDDGDEIAIEEGRHPVVEAFLDRFIPNDAYMNCRDQRLLIITGPNMAGKSTYMRQIALITLMAQMGSFVPAKSAHIGVVDRIFTRVGAFDDLTRGQSTFMVEMLEVANILNSATRKSLVLLDEIGRGTSTFDGMSIAWAVAEYMNDPERIGCRTLFATHYHELTELEGVLEGVKNYNVAVAEEEKEIVFLRRVLPGASRRSYGIQVAKLAGLPKDVIRRAGQVLVQMEAEAERVREHAVLTGGRLSGDGALASRPEGQAHLRADLGSADRPDAGLPGEADPSAERRHLGRGSREKRWVQTVLIDDTDPVMDRLEKVDVNALTPLEALSVLKELKQLAKER